MNLKQSVLNRIQRDEQETKAVDEAATAGTLLGCFAMFAAGSLFGWFHFGTLGPVGLGVGLVGVAVVWVLVGRQTTGLTALDTRDWNNGRVRHELPSDISEVVVDMDASDWTDYEVVEDGETVSLREVQD